MKKKYWIFLFAVILIGDLVGIQLNNNLVQSFLKPLIITTLIGYFDSQLNSITKGLAKWVLFALLFSLLGDVLLMFQEKKPIFFLLGLSAFLIAHIFYIIFFHKVRPQLGQLIYSVFEILVLVACKILNAVLLVNW